MNRSPFYSAEARRPFVAGFFSALALLAIFQVNDALAREDAYKRQEVVIKTRDGGDLGTAEAPVRTDPTGTTAQPVVGKITSSGGVVAAVGTSGGVPAFSHDPMCYSDACVEITATQVADGGTATLVAGQWYEVTTTGDGSGGIAGCWANGVALTTCTAKPRLKDGVVKPMAWPAAQPSVDAGVLNGKALLYFLSSTTTAMSAVFCPEVPCR